MLFYPCMNEPVYREAQTGWASLTIAVIMNLPASAMRRYSEYYFRKDIFAPSNATREQCQLNFMRVEDIMSYERFRQTEHYQFLRSIGFDYQSDLVLKAPDGRNTAYLAFFRTAEEGDFTDGFFSFLNDYISPLYLSSVHSSTFVSVYPMLDPLMEDLSMGVALLDNRAALLWSNRKAREYGQSFSDANKDEILTNIFFIGEDELPLQQLINQTGQRLMNERIARVSAPLSGTFTFFSRPFSVENVTGNIENRIIVFITRDGQDAPDMRKVLPETLTAREREILALICAGRSNREMTGLMNISMHTLRTHISNIYKKLGVSSKAALLIRMNKNK